MNINFMFQHPDEFLTNDVEDGIEMLKVYPPKKEIRFKQIRARALINTGSKISNNSGNFYDVHFPQLKLCPIFLRSVKAVRFNRGNKSIKKNKFL